MKKPKKKSRIILTEGGARNRVFPFLFWKGEDMKANLYLYDGPVKQFDRIIAEHWQQFTTALTEKQARTNLAYQYKRQNGLMPRANISLPGELVLVPRKEDIYGGL